MPNPTKSEIVPGENGGPAMRIERRSLSSLTPWEGNPRTITKAALDGLKASVKRFGIVQPVIVNERTGRIVGGHQRVTALRELGESETDVIVVDLPESEEKALNVALNSHAISGEWTPAALPLLAEIQMDMPEAFKDLRLDALQLDLVKTLGEPPKPLEDGSGEDVATPGVHEDPDSEIGDLYILGAHRLVCGNSMDRDEVARLLDGHKPGVVFTSPPYAQQRQYGDDASELVQDWDALMQGVFNAPVLADDAQVLVNLGLIHKGGEVWRYYDGWIEWMRSEGWKLFGWYVWDKITATFKGNDGRPYVAHEWVFHFNRMSVPCVEWVPCRHAGVERNVWGQRRPDGSVPALSTPGQIKDSKPPDTIARVQRETNNSDPSVRSHPARFPVSFAEYWIKTWPGSVYEPFAGSGSSMMACERLGRTCYAMELDPAYCDVIVGRWETLTGKKAERVRR